MTESRIQDLRRVMAKLEQCQVELDRLGVDLIGARLAHAIEALRDEVGDDLFLDRSPAAPAALLGKDRRKADRRG